MDARQQPVHDSTRQPPVHNPTHQPPTAHAYHASTQPQPAHQGQQPLHVPFSTSTDSYATSRRDPFFPQRSNHVRQRSHGALDGVSQTHDEGNAGWGNTGTHTGRVWTSLDESETAVAQLAWERATRTRRAHNAPAYLSAAGHVDHGPPQDLSCGLNFAFLHTSPPVVAPGLSLQRLDNATVARILACQLRTVGSPKLPYAPRNPIRQLTG